MYKEIIICIIIIVLVVGANFITRDYTNDSVETISKELNGIKVEMMKEEVDKEKIQKEMEEIYAKWEKYNENLSYYIEHVEIEKVQTELTALKANIEIGEYNQGIPDLERCIFILKHIQEKESLKAKNIF